MGMFDSFYDAEGLEWQSKALACLLNRYDIGDDVPGPPIDYQMELIGGYDEARPDRCYWVFATIRDGRLADLPCDRDTALPVLAYSSGWGDEFLVPEKHERRNAGSES
jgi:hypothetical protein